MMRMTASDLGRVAQNLESASGVVAPASVASTMGAKREAKMAEREIRKTLGHS